MSKKILISVLVLVVLGAACQVQAIEVQWDGPFDHGDGNLDNSWHTPENWDPVGDPNSGDVVTIDAATEEESADINLNNRNPGAENSNIEIFSLETYGYVELGAWGVDWMQFIITYGLTNYGDLEIVSDGWIGLFAEVTNDGFMELEGVEVEGTFTNDPCATVEVWGEVGFVSGIDNYGTIEVDPFSEMWVEGTLYNYNLIQLYGGACEAEGTLDNDPCGTIKGFGMIWSDTSFINDGDIIAEGGVLALYLEGTFENAGVLSNQFVSSVQIDAVADVNNLGNMYVRSGGGIAISNDLINKPGGTIELMGGTLGARSITQSSGAMFSGFGTIASPMGLTIEDGATVELTGPTNIIGNVSIDSGGTLIVRAGQTIITGATANNGTIVQIGGTVLFQGGYDGSGDNVDTTNSAEVIVDNGDAGTSKTGTWLASGKAGFYGTNSLYSYEVGATYSFEAWAVGAREISMWWTAHSTRATNVSVEIYDGATLLDTVTVNQQVNGGQWNALGYYTFTDKAMVKILTSTSGATIADAVKFSPTDVIVIDNGGAGTSKTGTWPASSKAGFYGTNSLYSYEVGATYSFKASTMGYRDVSMWWTAHSTRASSVDVEIYDGNTLLETVIVNQQTDGSQWNILGGGPYFFSGTAKVKILTSASGATIADAVKISP